MKIKFSRTTPFGRSGVYHKDGVYDVKDQAAAETYVKHGYASVVEQPADGPAIKSDQKPAASK